MMQVNKKENNNKHHTKYYTYYYYYYYMIYIAPISRIESEALCIQYSSRNQTYNFISFFSR